MKKSSMILFIVLRKVAYYLLMFATFTLGLTFFLSFLSLFDFAKEQGEHLGLSLERYLKTYKILLNNLFEFRNHSFIDYASNVSVLEGYLHSYTILGISLAIIIFAGTLIAFVVMLSPYNLRRKLIVILDLFEGLPDLVFIFSVNMLNIILLKEYNIKLFTLYGLGSNQPIVFPVIVISILPAIIFGLFLLKSMEDEEEEQYILVGFSKGLKKPYIYSVHMIRNVMPVFIIKFRAILYMLLSNLVLVEHMYYYEQAHTYEIWRQMVMGEHVLYLVYSVLMFILPIILFESLLKYIIKFSVIRKRGEMQL